MTKSHYDNSSRQLISELFELHQELKEDFLKEFGKPGISNNALTLEWLDNRDNSEIKNILRKLRKVIKHSDDVKVNYNIIRDVYILSPSLHELWFFNEHLESCFENLLKNRSGFKAYLTSKRRNTLDKNLQRITTYVFKNTILLENLTIAESKLSLMDKQDMTSNNVINDVTSIKDFYDKGSITKESIIQVIPVIFDIARSLLKQCEYKQLNSGTLLNIWFEYAPCSINEGPIFVPKTNKGLMDILSSIPSLEQEVIRNHLRKHFIVKEIK